MKSTVNTLRRLPLAIPVAVVEGRNEIRLSLQEQWKL